MMTDEVFVCGKIKNSARMLKSVKEVGIGRGWKKERNMKRQASGQQPQAIRGNIA